MKTAKFSEVVKKCGGPSIHLTWVDPAKDKTLKRALNETRVMTLHQELHGGKKDFGSVGFLKDRHAQVLVFPKSLRRFSGRKVIAIDYSLIVDGQLSLAVDSMVKKAKAPLQVAVPASPLRKPDLKVTAPPVSRSPKTGSSPPANMKKLLAEVKRAVTELAAGKSVPAYERLKRLLGTTQ